MNLPEDHRMYEQQMVIKTYLSMIYAMNQAHDVWAT